jgi:hypothetical protein
LNEIEDLKSAIRRLELWNQPGNPDWENCLKWLKELLAIKEAI